RREPMRKSVLITGSGAVSCVGTSVSAFWEANLHGRSGLSKESRYDLGPLPCGLVTGRIPDDSPEVECSRDKHRSLPRVEVLARAAADEALKHASLQEGVVTRIAVVTSIPKSMFGTSPREFEDAVRMFRTHEGNGNL